MGKGRYRNNNGMIAFGDPLEAITKSSEKRHAESLKEKELWAQEKAKRTSDISKRQNFHLKHG